MQPAELTLALWEADLLSDGALADWMSSYLSANAPTTPLLLAIQQHHIIQDQNRLNSALLGELLRAHSLPKASFNLMLAYQLEGLRRACLSEEALLVFLIRHMNHPDCPPFIRHSIEQAETCWIDLGDKAGAWQIVSTLLAEQRLKAQLDRYRNLAAELFNYHQPSSRSVEERHWQLVREG